MTPPAKGRYVDDSTVVGTSVSCFRPRRIVTTANFSFGTGS